MLLVDVVHHCQDHMKLLDVSGSTKHCPIDGCVLRMYHKLRGDGKVVLFAGDGVPHQDLVRPYVADEHEAMAASKGHKTVVVIVVALQGEAAGRDTTGGKRCWNYIAEPQGKK